MRSAAWAGNWPITQPQGCTVLAVEPYWDACPTKHCHCGIDVGLPKGTPLFAVRPGFVSELFPGILGIRVASGQTDFYIHGEYPNMRVGQTVARHQPIGFSSDIVPSGGVLFGPHLHFEVQAAHPDHLGKGPALNYPGTALNPMPVLEETMNVYAQAHMYYLAGLGRPFKTNADGSYEAQWLIDALNKNPDDIGATLGAVLNSSEGKTWAALQAVIRGYTPDQLRAALKDVELASGAIPAHQHHLDPSGGTETTGGVA